MGMEKYTPNRAHFFMCKKYTTFSTERIVALRSVDKIFLENYDFAAIHIKYATFAYEKSRDVKHLSSYLCLFPDNIIRCISVFVSKQDLKEFLYTCAKVMFY
jgi:hypothetical protein